MSDEIKLGDYVLASENPDYYPLDPWRLGFVVRIIDTWKPHPTLATRICRSYIIGEQNGTWEDFREYRYAQAITKEEAKEWLETESRTT
jgi:hypothetical protein